VGAPTTTATPTPTAPPPSGPPPKLSLDTDKSLTATPGDGAGVFVTYRDGGHWSIKWTCDTNSSQRTCAFDVSVTTQGISNFVAMPASSIVARDAVKLRAQTDTAATIDGLDIDVAPGSSIVLSATINGAPAPNLVFYVSNGKLTTEPTDPVEFVPTAP
jgi:hypothetical protein